MAIKLLARATSLIAECRCYSNITHSASNTDASHHFCGSSTGERTSLDCFAPLAVFPHAGINGGSALSCGRLLHAHLLKTTIDIQSITETHLVQMYCQCGCLEDACVLFCALHPRSLLSTWNAMIKVYIKHGQINGAKQIFDQMMIEGCVPASSTFTSLTPACMDQAALPDGRRLHARVSNSDLCADVVIGTAMVAMYGKCGSLDEMQSTFDRLPSRDVISWTVLITTYVQCGKTTLALEIFFLMQSENVSATKITLITVLSACTAKDLLPIGMELDACIKSSGFESDINVGNALITMYGKCGSVEDARAVFDSMQEWNLVSWNAIIAVYAQNGNGEEALCISYRMQQGMLPDDISLVSMLDACTSLGAVSVGKRIHACISKVRLEENITLRNALVTMYGKCDSLEEAVQFFHTMYEHDLITWNALISVFSSKEKGAKVLEFLSRMQQEGFMPNRRTFSSAFAACASLGELSAAKKIHSQIANSSHEVDVVVGTAIVNMYGKSQSPSYAREVFDMLPLRNVVCWTAMISAYAKNEQVDEALILFNSTNERQDAVLWNSMLAAFSQNQQGKKTLALFEQMLQEGILPNLATFISSLDATTNETVLRDGKLLHSRMRGAPFEHDIVLQNSLVSMYGRCGSLKVAWKLFEQLQARTVFAWSSMIAAYGQKGLGEEALAVFTQMRQEGALPDKITFVSVLSACSHAGLVHDACEYFTLMQDGYGIAPMVDHYNCMIDLLGRSGQLDEAEKLILNMKVRPTTSTWLTLLSACRNNVDVRRGEWAAKFLFKIDPNIVSPYIMLSSLYTSAGRMIDAANVIFELHCRGLKHESLNPNEVHSSLSFKRG
ncbi:hypothetical protein L7F22_065515 [Adiantum nelumboides]|nr:hypothetical protein [Adiantum nelumboides]